MSHMSHFFKSLVQRYIYLLCLDPVRNDSERVNEKVSQRESADERVNAKVTQRE